MMSSDDDVVGNDGDDDDDDGEDRQGTDRSKCRRRQAQSWKTEQVRKEEEKTGD